MSEIYPWPEWLGSEHFAQRGAERNSGLNLENRARYIRYGEQTRKAGTSSAYKAPLMPPDSSHLLHFPLK
jgi:hypothetical protein